MPHVLACDVTVQYKPREKIDSSNASLFESGILLLICKVSFTSMFLPLSKKPLGKSNDFCVTYLSVP